jgi:hypothetical protein
MIPEAREVRLSAKERKVLEACCRSPRTLQRDLSVPELFCLRRLAGALGRLPRRSVYSRGSPAFGGIALPMKALGV